MGCKIHTRKDGYQVIWIDGKLKYYHRYLAEKYIPNPNNYPVVNHIDGNPSKNSLDNLEWCTKRKNCEHARLNGLSELKLQGIKDLTKEQVLQIRELRKEGNTYKDISKQFNRDYRTIWDICNFKRYKDYAM